MVKSETVGHEGEGTVSSNGEIMRRAREALKGKWGPAVGVVFVYFAISTGIGIIYPKTGWIVSTFVSGPFTLGLSMFFIGIARGDTPPLTRMFEGFKRFPTALATYLLMILLIIFWLLLLIIPGIIASLSYSMTFYILADDEQIGPMDAINKSKEMMKGHKVRLLMLMLRFLGWAFLCVLTLGIGFLWLTPYVNTSVAAFYEEIRPDSAARESISRWL
ncbi:MAG: DUF975 family protein [Chitinivibrionales bacterium]|nr:DUF975 family protein [Chitinivibrionales bacterium]MBD3357589.1 DUF975 family protein [Chitinivibrionales bacterium]